MERMTLLISTVLALRLVGRDMGNKLFTRRGLPISDTEVNGPVVTDGCPLRVDAQKFSDTELSFLLASRPEQ